MPDINIRMVRAVEGIQKAIEAFDKSQRDIAVAASKMYHPAFVGTEIKSVKIHEDDISTTITLENPDISGVTTIYRQDDGFLRIEILVEPPGSDRLMELVEVLPITEFNLQAVEPD